MAEFDIVAAAQTQRPQLPPGWQPDLQRMLSDIVPMLSAEKRHTFREFVKDLKAKRDAREIPSLSAALMEQAPQVVGADLWQQCIARQREEAAELPRLEHASLHPTKDTRKILSMNVFKT